jgi:hypothetical protein
MNRMKYNAECTAHQTTLLYVTPLRTVQYSTVQYSTVQYSTVQYSTVQYSTVQYSTGQYSTVQYSTVQYSTVQYYAALHSIHHSMTPHTTQYSTVLHHPHPTLHIPCKQSSNNPAPPFVSFRVTAFSSQCSCMVSTPILSPPRPDR